MLTLSNCENDKHNAWWDFEAEIQRELEALDAHDSAYASGNSQMEVVEEKENVNMVDRVADDFKNLLNRFHLQNEKLLHFEQSVFSPGKCIDALLEDSMAKTAYPGVDLDPAAHSYSSQSCFLTQQHLIRPLYCIDQEDNVCFNGERDGENYYPCKKNKGSTKKLAEVHTTRLMPEVCSGQRIVREMKKVKGFPMHDMGKIQESREIRIVENVKDRLLHSLHLNYKYSMRDKLKLKSRDPKSCRRDFLLDTALITCQDKGSKAVSIQFESGTTSFIGCQAGSPSTRANDALTQFMKSPYVQSIHTSIRKGRQRPILIPNFSHWEWIVVNNASHDMTKTRMLKQHDIIAHIGTHNNNYVKLKQLDTIAQVGTHIDMYFSGPRKITTYITDGCVPYAPLSQLNKAVVSFFDNTGLPSQNACTSHFFQEFSLMYRQQLCSGHAFARNERQLFLNTKYRQVVEKAKHSVDYSSRFQLCALEHAHAWDDNERAVLQENKDLPPESNACVQEIVKLQAVVRGFLARQHHRIRLATKKRRLSFLASKIQACWRGYILRRACLKRVESERMKNINLSGDGCLQPCGKLEISTYVRRIVILQALARGFLARKYRRTILLQEENNVYILVSKIQALWKGWRVRTSEVLKQLRSQKMLQSNALIKFQAVWRGSRTRKRFQVALKTSKYNDHDDFEYALVDENDYLPRERCFEELSTVCHQRSTHSFQLNLKSNAFQEIDENELRINLNKKPKEDAKAMTYREQLESMKENLEKDEGSALTNLSSFRRNLADNESSTNSRLEKVFGDEQVDMYHHKTLGRKHQQTIIETKTAMAEIAKDWGFKEEKTALQFIRALNNTRRRAEILMAPKLDSQTRLRKFMARSGRHNEISKKSN